ncbi:hypothetical protein [Lysinibacillus sp. G4S2]|uniref:hypothetical protein n=1 Tax=Lysinibacillus sp. G4S2 TaxID=3055859 RepID=UPI0025A1349B|nr:hypothetical protein [Lysinibacillus sp. G4S2]MDM5248406.1 hypothetical protein [Lysinibacillus sp. G4S2]
MLDINQTTAWIDLLSTYKVNPKYGNPDVIDQYLDQRDADPFDSQWMAAHGDLTAIIDSKLVTDRKKIEMLQDRASKQIYETIIGQTSHSDLAAYASDDVRLIVGYLVTGRVNSFALEMKENYERGDLPNVEGSPFS